jgi:hypothetical protein
MAKLLVFGLQAPQPFANKFRAMMGAFTGFDWPKKGKTRLLDF